MGSHEKWLSFWRVIFHFLGWIWGCDQNFACQNFKVAGSVIQPARRSLLRGRAQMCAHPASGAITISTMRKWSLASISRYVVNEKQESASSVYRLLFIFSGDQWQFAGRLAVISWPVDSRPSRPVRLGSGCQVYQQVSERGPKPG